VRREGEAEEKKSSGGGRGRGREREWRRRRRPSDDFRFYPRLSPDPPLACLLHIFFSLSSSLFFSLAISNTLLDYSHTLTMASLPSLLRSSSRTLFRPRKPALQIPALRSLSTKHPSGFVPPTDEDLTELRERVQEFTSGCRRRVPVV
jgi:hypothetical protein